MNEDVSRGLEKTPIPVVCSNFEFPSFQYINSSMVHDRAKLTPPSLSTLRDGTYCTCPGGDCLRTKCACACATAAKNARFAYRAGGFLKDSFLQDRIVHDCTKTQQCYCTELQRLEAVLTCGMHRSSAFISECNMKCGCHAVCGNRTVQQGMKYAVEIFHTGDRGWGVCAKVRIPRGAFVFEMTGEILTNAEQIVQNRGMKPGPTYTLQIDADWAAESVLDDNSALCLDASRFGNVARFLNHRCESANLVDVPVLVGRLDRSYYRLAFFTTRIIRPLEELTWDYGIDFSNDDPDLPSFDCKCGSSMCRDMAEEICSTPE